MLLVVLCLLKYTASMVIIYLNLKRTKVSTSNYWKSTSASFTKQLVNEKWLKVALQMLYEDVIL